MYQQFADRLQQVIVRKLDASLQALPAKDPDARAPALKECEDALHTFPPHLQAQQRQSLENVRRHLQELADESHTELAHTISMGDPSTLASKYAELRHNKAAREQLKQISSVLYTRAGECSKAISNTVLSVDTTTSSELHHLLNTHWRVLHQIHQLEADVARLNAETNGRVDGLSALCDGHLGVTHR